MGTKSVRLSITKYSEPRKRFLLKLVIFIGLFDDWSYEIFSGQKQTPHVVPLSCWMVH